MSVIIDRWPGLLRLPRVPLSQAPTPVHRLAGLSDQYGAEIWCKRDDLTATGYGGNKVRKLEHLLGDARDKGADTLITAGAFGSHHVLATVYHGTRSGFEVHATLCPQRWSPHVLENLLADVALGAVLHRVPHHLGLRAAMSALAAKLRLLGRRPYVIGPGGSSPVGTTGYVEAGIELAEQIDQRVLPEPEAIFVALGTGGTAIGIALGLAAMGLTCKVIAYRVTDRSVANKKRLRSLLEQTHERIREAEPRFPNVLAEAWNNLRIDHSQFAPGYGEEHEDARRASVLFERREGLVLDGTYTGRAAAGMLEVASGLYRHKKLLFWHTLNRADLTPIVKNVVDVPVWIRKKQEATQASSSP